MGIRAYRYDRSASPLGDFADESAQAAALVLFPLTKIKRRHYRPTVGLPRAVEYDRGMKVTDWRGMVSLSALNLCVFIAIVIDYYRQGRLWWATIFAIVAITTWPWVAWRSFADGRRRN